MRTASATPRDCRESTTAVSGPVRTDRHHMNADSAHVMTGGPRASTSQRRLERPWRRESATTALVNRRHHLRGRRSPAISMPAPETPVSRPAVCRWTWLRTCCSYGASTSPARPRRSVSSTTSWSACSMRSQPRATRSSRVALAAGGVTTKPFVSRLAMAGDSFPSSLDVVAAVSRGRSSGDARTQQQQAGQHEQDDRPPQRRAVGCGEERRHCSPRPPDTRSIMASRGAADVSTAAAAAGAGSLPRRRPA